MASTPEKNTNAVIIFKCDHEDPYYTAAVLNWIKRKLTGKDRMTSEDIE